MSPPERQPLPDLDARRLATLAERARDERARAVAAMLAAAAARVRALLRTTRAEARPRRPGPCQG